MWKQRLMWIAWPAFLMAGVMEMVVFAFVDPEALQWFDQPVPLRAQPLPGTGGREAARLRQIHALTRAWGEGG